MVFLATDSRLIILTKRELDVIPIIWMTVSVVGTAVRCSKGSKMTINNQNMQLR